MDKIKIIEAGNELGLGGTEYVIQLYSKLLNKENFEVLVLGIRDGGARAKIIQEMGINVIVLNSDMIRFAELLQNTDVFHWHGDGSLNPEIFNVVKANRPKLVIQTNIFGAYTHSELYDTIDYDLYVSKMILIRRMVLDRFMQDSFAGKRKTLHNPVDVDHINELLPEEDQVQKFKAAHDLQNCFITGRIGRADNAKFDLITLDAFAEFSRNIPQARFLLVGATANIIAHAETLGITSKLIIFENTSDLKQLLIYYRTIDIFLAASRIGESFGMVIAEAMVAGIPVVTINTPNRDNAQVELVDNGKTGLIIDPDKQKIASALLFLYQNEEIRAELSIASKNKVTSSYKADLIVKSLENLIYQHFSLPFYNSEPSLIIDFSREIVEDYISRYQNLWEPDNNL